MPLPDPGDLTDTDYAILAELPPEGAKLGYHHIGVTVSGLRMKFAKHNMDSNALSGRLRSLMAFGLTVNVELANDPSHGWQITPLGGSYLAAWKEVNRNSNDKEEVTS